MTFSWCATHLTSSDPQTSLVWPYYGVPFVLLLDGDNTNYLYYAAFFEYVYIATSHRVASLCFTDVD